MLQNDSPEILERDGSGFIRKSGNKQLLASTQEDCTLAIALECNSSPDNQKSKCTNNTLSTSFNRPQSPSKVFVAFRSPSVRQFCSLSAVTSSKCSTYGVKALNRNVLSELKHDATFRTHSS